MEVIFCANPLNLKKVDPNYIDEVQAVSACSFDYSLFNDEALVNDNNISKAFKLIPKTQQLRPAIYRGWMMTPDKYTIFYHALKQLGIKLINTPTQYQHCHYLPESYALIQKKTPKTVWIKNGDNFSIKAIMTILEPFGNCPIILKDYVKSQKHYWHEACFIPSATDEKAVSKVVERFLQLQGGQPEGGLVFREYIAFESIGKHLKSAMPLSLEYRIFFWHQKPMALYPYWNEIKYPNLKLPLEIFTQIAQGVESHFFTMDIAKSPERGWLVVELGDGQVAGLPDNIDIKTFYQKIKFQS